MEIKIMPKDTLAELLFFLAENCDFYSIEKLLDSEMTLEEVRSALRELGQGLLMEVSKEGAQGYNPQDDSKLSKEAKAILSYLSPGEEKTLLSAFGFIEKPKVILKKEISKPKQ